MAIDKREQNIERDKMIGRAADQLYEHARCVVVMVLFDDETSADESFFVFRGGSHAAVGLADEFINIRHKERGPIGKS